MLEKEMPEAELQAVLDELQEIPLRVETVGGAFRSVTPSAQFPGQWQVTFFDRDMQPSGHENHTTYRKAVNEVVGPGNTLSVIDAKGTTLNRTRVYC